MCSTSLSIRSPHRRPLLLAICAIRALSRPSVGAPRHQNGIPHQHTPTTYNNLAYPPTQLPNYPSKCLYCYCTMLRRPPVAFPSHPSRSQVPAVTHAQSLAVRIMNRFLVADGTDLCHVRLAPRWLSPSSRRRLILSTSFIPCFVSTKREDLLCYVQRLRTSIRLPL